MKDKTKEILIDLVDYYSALGTDYDLGMLFFENVAHRASDALREHAKEVKESLNSRSSANVDPFAETGEYLLPDFDMQAKLKSEEEW